MDFNLDNLAEELIAKRLGLVDYKKIIEAAESADVSLENEAFQKVFNRFYVVRRNETWRGHFYKLFEENKNKSDVKFSDIIHRLYADTGRVEASFASKMLATLNTDMPIWDSKVLAKLKKKLDGKTGDERLDNAIALYDQIIAWYCKFLVSDDGKKCIAAFDDLLPQYNRLSNTKKIDFLLWASPE